MPLLLEVPDEIVAALRLPREEVERELRAELAVVLYARGAVSIGKATEMSQLSRWGFEELLGKRNVTRNYSEEDLRHDLEWGRESSEARH